MHLLLDAGADVNALDCDEWTCQHLVRSPAMARLLLERGADPSILTRLGTEVEERRLTEEVREVFRKARLEREGGG